MPPFCLSLIHPPSRRGHEGGFEGEGFPRFSTRIFHTKYHGFSPTPQGKRRGAGRSAPRGGPHRRAVLTLGGTANRVMVRRRWRSRHGRATSGGALPRRYLG